ncbi:FAD-dependent oxidoreductase [Curvibacter sp. APW13]|uniref:FAD-dependent oxidoreductase n=1 Tax=Curvibacter sp. APW13 TaxID=3077236 RepID=UPI0028DEAC64|nr:FAD-dependent oxidoreductase [Curvibacter sp. APW13]MDT8991273.1 FAD-dependent oxidoreductase [Curvibacter sp. APW13]
MPLPTEPARVAFTLNGQACTADHGISLMAAMANAGQATTRISVGGEARSALCGMGVCQECRVTVDGQRRLACQTPVCEGMVVQRLDGNEPVPQPLPSAPAGQATAHCDVLVLGAGPAGLEAAQAAAEAGAQVVLVDDNPLPGGQIWRQRPGAPSEAHALTRRIDAQRTIERHSATRAVSFPAPGQVLLEGPDSAWVQSYQHLILCSGARERLLPFPGWTLPGVTGAGALQALVKAGTQVAGQRVVVAGSGPLLLAVAHTLREHGAQVPQVAEQAPWSAMIGTAAALWRWPGKLVQAARLHTAAWQPGTVVVRALGTERLEAVRLRQGAREWEQACDRLACGYGLVPNNALARLAGCTVDAADAVVVDSQMATSVAGIWAAGELTGPGGSERARVQGRMAGYAATGQTERAQNLRGELRRWQAFADTMAHGFALGESVRQLADDDTVLCRCEDLTVGEVRHAGGWQQAKLQTRCGMGPCQGRTCATAAQTLWGWETPAPREPVVPVRIDSLLQR